MKTSSPNSHVSPSIGSSRAEPFRATFVFFNVVPAAAWVLPVLLFVVDLRVRFVLTLLEDKTLRNAKTKTIELI